MDAFSLFDATAYLDSDETIAEYLTAALKDDNPDVFLAALADVAKARSKNSPMISNRSMPPGAIIPVLIYDDVAAAVAWLCEVFGFKERLRIGDHRAQLTFGEGSVVVAARSPDATGTPPGERTHSIMVRVADVDAHYERVRQRGGRILGPPETYPFGERQYSVDDPGGHRWTFSQAVADVAPEAWGGRLL